MDLPTALLLSASWRRCAPAVLPAWRAAPLLLIRWPCNMFGIPNDIAMQVVAVGFIIGVLQDSCETALNSSTDVLFTAAACMAEDERWRKNAAARLIPTFPPLLCGGFSQLRLFSFKRIDTAFCMRQKRIIFRPLTIRKLPSIKRATNRPSQSYA